MRLTRASESRPPKKSSGLPEPRDVSGIALFMVMSAIAVLSILVSEFSYIAQVNERMAFDSLDQVKALYLAKSGLKLSLLRLKAYAQVKATMGGGAKTGGGMAGNPLSGALPPEVLQQIWSFPFMYPLPSLPDMTISQKDAIKEFEKKSGLDGKLSAVIEAESSKYNINTILPGFGPNPSPNPSASQPAPGPSNTPATPPGSPNTNPSASPSYDPTQARKSLHDYLQNLMLSKEESDPDFQRDYQDFQLDDLIDYIAQWADHSYVSNFPYPRDWMTPKRAPFYNITELHMIPTMDDELYDLFSKALTASPTIGININTMQEATLRALVPQMTDDEIQQFFKFRDDPTVDNTFKKDTDFFNYLKEYVAAFRSDPDLLTSFQQQLQKENIQLVTDETDFRITVQATVNQAVRTIEADVTLTGVGSGPLTGMPANGAPPAAPINPMATGPQGTPVPDSGLRINFMRVL